MTEAGNIKPWDQRLAYIVIRPFKDSPLHPNHLTTITLLLGIATALTFAFSMENLAWLGALLYMLAVFSDHMDGELARLTGKISKFGHNYDYIVGGVNYTMLFISIGIGLGRSHGDWALLLGLCAGLSNPLILYLRMTMEIKYGNEAVEHPSRSGFEIEDSIYLIGPICWLAGIVYFFVPFAIGCIGYLIWTVMEYRKWQRQTAEKINQPE